MRSAFAILCLALPLAGCRGTGSGLFGQVTIPPPGTQPPGSLLADHSYYPGTTPPVAGSLFAAPPTSSWAASPIPFSTSPVSPGSAATSDSQLTDRRGASLSRANLAGPARSLSANVREEPIRIPDDSATTGTLAAVIPIRGIPTTDATGHFQQVRSQLTPSATLAAQARVSSGFVEISQLPNPPADVRLAALSRQELR